MEPLLKYIIYFLLGLICHYLLFKGDLIEGLEFDNYDEVISNTSCQIKDCKNGWTKTDLNTSYTSNDVQELRKVAGSPMGDGEENIQLYYNNNNNTCSTYEKYDKLCFKTDKVKSETLFLIKPLVLAAPVALTTPSVIKSVAEEKSLVPTSVIILPCPDHATVAIPSMSKSKENSFTEQSAIL